MTRADPPRRHQRATQRSMPDQGLGGIVRTGRKIPAVAPDPRRQRQLVGAVARPDDALVEGHADAPVELLKRGSRDERPPAQAASAALVRGLFSGETGP